MDEFPIAGDIASKISGATSTGRLLLPNPKRIKDTVALAPIEIELRIAFAANFPDQRMWQPVAVSDNMRAIAEFVGGPMFVLLLLLKNMNRLEFSTILIQFIYNTKGVYLQDPFPEMPGERMVFAIWHILENVLNPDRKNVASFGDRDGANDPRRTKAFNEVNRQFNLKQPPAERVKSEDGTSDGGIEDAKMIIEQANEAIKLMMMHFDRFVAENSGALAFLEPGIDGMISFFESRVIPRINDLIEQSNRPAEVFPSKLDVAITEIVYRFDRQLQLEGLPGMRRDDIYMLDASQRTYFVSAVQKYLIFMKMAPQSNYRTLQFDSANKDPTIAVTLAIANHFQRWKGGKNNKPRFL